MQRSLAAILISLTAFAAGANAATVSVLYAFRDTSDGAKPQAALVFGRGGTLYGVSANFGTHGYGTVFSFVPGDASITVLHQFTNGADGAYPSAQLAVDAQGNLYGTTKGDGTNTLGSVFKLNPVTAVLTTLHSFVGNDGENPMGQLLVDRSSGDLFGITQNGGKLRLGNVYTINPKTKAFTILHTFGNSGGFDPEGGLVEDANGTLYGTTNEVSGGTFNGGLVFALDPTGGSYRVVHRFSPQQPYGIYPSTKMVLDKNGILYGTTRSGGSVQGGHGTVFRLDPGSGKIAALRTFSGDEPLGDLALDSHGTLFGTTFSSAYSLRTNGVGYMEIALTNANLVAGVEAGVTLDRFDDRYGTSFEGGGGLGTIYEVTP